MTTAPKLIRPVRCYFCSKPMFYAGDANHVPEVRVEVDGGSEGCHLFYAHVTCWNERIVSPPPATPREAGGSVAIGP